MSIAQSILSESLQEAETTKRLFQAIPADKLSWRPHPKSMSLGQLALHIARATGAVPEAAVPDASEVPDFQNPDPGSLGEIHAALSKGLERATKALNQIDDARMNGMWRLTRKGAVVLEMPRVAFLRSIMLNHVYHHRGQLSVYLRLLDVPLPSIYGPSADTNPFS